MVSLLVVVAGSLFLLMGTLHAALTFRDLERPRAFTPPDAALREAMQRSSIRLNAKINLWKAWLGFNFTHSLGLVLFGGGFVYVGALHAEAFTASGLLQALAVLTASAYVILSAAYFFSRPLIGSAVGLLCFLGAIGLAQA